MFGIVLWAWNRIQSGLRGLVTCEGLHDWRACLWFECHGFLPMPLRRRDSPRLRPPADEALSRFSCPLHRAIGPPSSGGNCLAAMTMLSMSERASVRMPCTSSFLLMGSSYAARKRGPYCMPDRPQSRNSFEPTRDAVMKNLAAVAITRCVQGAGASPQGGRAQTAVRVALQHSVKEVAGCAVFGIVDIVEVLAGFRR